MHLRELLITYLHSLREQGLSTLPVDESARAILREWMLAARRGAPLPSLSPSSAAQVVAGPKKSLMQEIEEEIAEEERAAALRPPEEDEEPLPFFRPPGGNPQEQWASFAGFLPRWKPLRELGTLREKAVPGQGSRAASIMLVGDAPGYYDERAALPFQGDAGAKLDGMLRAMGLTRDEVYLTHLVKFRPAMPRQTFNNRPPTAREVQLSVPVLRWEVQMVQPRVIVALGVVAARGLLGCGELPLAACQALQGSFCEVPVVVTHHPSYLLRTSDVAERRRLWEEMLRVMEMAGMEITARQRSYFLRHSS